MTQNQIAYKKAEEEARHNKEDEALKERSSKRSFWGSLIGSAISAGGRTVPALINKRGKEGGRVRGNDAQWYLNYEQLAKDAASISFLNPLGSVTPGSTLIGGTAITSTNSVAEPGIMVIPYLPTFGDLSSPSAVANQIALRLYSYVRHANSGSRNYDVPDLMQYVLAVVSAMSLVAVLRTMYGIARKFSVVNKYKGSVLLRQFGVNPDELYQNLSDFRSKVNTYVLKLQSFAMPTMFSYLTRQLWLNEHVWLDDPNEDKAQCYLFMPAAVWRYDPKYGKLYLEKVKPCYYSNRLTNGSGSFDYTYVYQTDSNTVPLSDIYDQLDGIIDDLLSIEDIGIMSGDILKAFNDTGLFKLYEISEDYVTDFQYSKEVLSQIHNITPRNVIFDASSVKDLDPNGAGVTTAQLHAMLHTCITQTLKGVGTGKFLLFEPVVSFVTDDANDYPNALAQWSLFNDNPTNVQTKGAIVDSIETITPDIGQVLVMTRGTNAWTTKSVVFAAPVGETYTFTGLDSYGSEIFLYPYVVSFTKLVQAATAETVSLNKEQILITLVTNNEAFQESGNGADWGFYQAAVIKPFAFHPVHRNGYCNGNPVTVYDSRDMVNATFVAKEELKKMHYVAVTSLFMIPEFK